jgi:hypothetical protein
MARERFERDTRERKLVSDLIVTVTSQGLFSLKAYFLEKIDTIYNQNGFLTQNTYTHLNVLLLDVAMPSQDKTSFLEDFNAVLNLYRSSKRLSLLPPRVLMFNPPREFNPPEIRSAEMPSHNRGMSLQHG